MVGADNVNNGAADLTIEHCNLTIEQRHHIMHLGDP